MIEIFICKRTRWNTQVDANISNPFTKIWVFSHPSTKIWSSHYSSSIFWSQLLIIIHQRMGFKGLRMFKHRNQPFFSKRVEFRNINKLISQPYNGAVIRHSSITQSRGSKSISLYTVSFVFVRLSWQSIPKSKKVSHSATRDRDLKRDRFLLEIKNIPMCY